MLEDKFPRTWFTNYEKIKVQFHSEYEYAELDTLRDEICKCLILDLNMASITLTNHLLEDFLKKMLIYKTAIKSQKSIFEAFDESTDKYNSLNLYDSIEKAYEKKLIDEIQRSQLHSFRTDFRNPFSHADSKKIFQDMTVGIQAIDIENEKLNFGKQEQIEVSRTPFIHGFAKIVIAKKIATDYFKLVDKLINDILEKIKKAHNSKSYPIAGICFVEKLFVNLAIGTAKKNTTTKTATGYICKPLATIPLREKFSLNIFTNVGRNGQNKCEKRKT